jgi:HlyD family secretion protein
VGAGTPVLTVVDTGRLGLLAEVDETDVLLVSTGVAGYLELDAAPGARYAVRVGTVDALPAASAGGGVSYRARLELSAGRYPDGRSAPVPRPGMSGVAHLTVRQVADAVVVPAAAVFTDGDRDAVWLVRSGRAVRQVVRSGVAGADRVQILDGVRPGDRVVVSGTDKVRAGQRLP